MRSGKRSRVNSCHEHAEDSLQCKRRGNESNGKKVGTSGGALFSEREVSKGEQIGRPTFSQKVQIVQGNCVQEKASGRLAISAESFRDFIKHQLASMELSRRVRESELDRNLLK